jgi:lysosomal Pro-X carboxypeptidase
MELMLSPRVLLSLALIRPAASLGFLARLGHLPALEGRPGVPNTTLQVHDQILDHFDYGETRTFRQRVFTYDKFWSRADTTAPILFYCGNEANVELYVNSTGLMWERAAELGALLVFAEHRYYGESLPFGAESAANASTLRWLSMEQALADYATLIYTLKRDLGVPHAPVIAIGGSYGGMLAAWLRMKYPDAVVGAIAASAPVLAFEGVLGREQAWDPNAFWQVVTSDATVEPGGCVAGCVPGVRAAWPALFKTAKTAKGRASLARTFRLCEHELSRPTSIARLSAWLLNVWDTLAMGNFPYPSNYLVFQQTCGTLTLSLTPSLTPSLPLQA